MSTDRPTPTTTAGLAVLRTFDQREAVLLAPYAMHGAQSVGRKHPESPHAYRSPFQRDRDRIVHCSAFRRLSSKTQVFTGELGDYHRTRLTHTMEVASISRTLGRALALNEDLIEALALVHDLGHPPFGHSGEDVLDECLAEVGGFSHNQHGLRIVEELELRYAEFPGLNLSMEVLEGQRTRINKLHADCRPLLEVQVVEAADSIAYDTHDADDALKLGLLSLDDLLRNSLWAEAARRIRLRSAAVSDDAMRRAILHELIDWQVSDLLARATQRLADERIDSPAVVRNASYLIAASPEISGQKAELERFLYERVYRHPQVLRHRIEAQSFLRAMFAGYVQQPELLPESFRARVDVHGLPRTVGDYLAGMTDRFAQREYFRLFAPRPLD